MTPWAAVDLDPGRPVAELARRFPGCCAWRGEYTGRWWALAQDRTGRDRLIEAPDPARLGRLLEDWTGRDYYGRYSRASLQNRTDGRPLPSLPMASRPAGWVRRVERRPRGRWLRRLLGLLVVV